MDFGLSTNEILLFENESCNFIEKNKLRDNFKISHSSNQGRPDFAIGFEAKETFGNTLRAKIAAKGLLSPTNTKYEASIKGSVYGDFDETKSVRSAVRSLSITNPKAVTASVQPVSLKQAFVHKKNLAVEHKSPDGKFDALVDFL